MKKLLLSLLLAAAPGFAAEWQDVGAPGPDRMFYDPAKLHIDADAVTYWRRVEFRMPRATADGLAYSGLFRERIDCAQHSLATLGYLLYSANGNVIENVYVPKAPSVPIVPDSAAERFENALCTIARAQAEKAQEAANPDAAELKRLQDQLKTLEQSIQKLKDTGSTPADSAAGAKR